MRDDRGLERAVRSRDALDIEPLDRFGDHLLRRLRVLRQVAR